MELLICNDCGIMDMGIVDHKCEKCRQIERLEREKQELLYKIEELSETSKQWVMDFVGDASNQKNYHYHLGQIAAFTDVKNILNVINK